MKKKKGNKMKDKTLREILDSIPYNSVEGFDPNYKVKSLAILVEEINKLGYIVQAHQLGIRGTFLCATPILNKINLE